MQQLCMVLSVSASLLLGTAFIGGCSSGGVEEGSTSSSADGATSSAAHSEAVESRGTIGFSALTLKNPFFKIIADSMTEAGRKHGFEVLVNDADRDVYWR